MGFFDDIRAQAEDFLGQGSEQISNSVEDVTGNLGDIGQQVEDIIPGDQGGEEGK